MPTEDKTLIDLETRFWQSMVDQKADAAIELLAEPAVMVSAHGVMQFDHAAYRKMAEQGSMVVTAFAFDDMKVLFPNESTAVLTYRVTQSVGARGKGDGTRQQMNDSSTWVKGEAGWKCVMHTETPVDEKAAARKG